jgi:TonB family protein
MSGCCSVLCVLLGTFVPGVCQSRPPASAEAWGVVDENCLSIVESEVRVKEAHPHSFHPYPRPPRYPAKAIRERVSGSATVWQQVSETGHVTAVAVVASEPPGFFEQAALNHARSVVHVPYVVAGSPVCFSYTRRIEFTISGGAP